jgi:lipoprotein-anchoring transpeptidase ErfK/SrfK
MKCYKAIGLAIIGLSTIATTNAYQSHYSQNYYQPVQKIQRFFVFDPHRNHWAAYENNRKIRSGVANGGAPYGHETPTGVYRILDKKGPGYRSNEYPINPDGTRGGAQMPYAMHFTNSGHAIHGSPGISRQNTSHGCIRVKLDDARWLNEYFMIPGSKVVVYNY